MRKVRMAILANLFLVAGIFANAPKETDPSSKLETQVRDLLSGYSLETDEHLSATILFTVNKKNEFVVLSVNTTDEFLEYYVKSKLNYHKVDSAKLLKGRRYTIPIMIKS